MSLSPKELILKVLQEHSKGLVGIGSIDVTFLGIMGWAYVEKGDISYLQWLHIFEKEAYFSGLAVVSVWLIIILFWYLIEKERRSPYIV